MAFAPPTTRVCGGIVDPKTQYEGYLSWVARMEKETMEHYTAGDAFPGHGEPGMTILDWFAGMAMQGLVANEGIRTQKRLRLSDARLCYELAENMIEARADVALSNMNKAGGNG